MANFQRDEITAFKGKSATALSFYSQRESIRLGYARLAIRSGPLNVSLEQHAVCECFGQHLAAYHGVTEIESDLIGRTLFVTFLGYSIARERNVDDQCQSQPIQSSDRTSLSRTSNMLKRPVSR